MAPEQDPEMQAAIEAWFAEQANLSPFAIELERKIGLYPSEIHLLAIQAKREEDVRFFEVIKDISCPTPG